MLKPRIWLDPGVMISLDPDDISAVFYRKGFFSGWKIINESTTFQDLEMINEKVRSSWGKSIRVVGKLFQQDEPDRYRVMALSLLGEIRLNKSVNEKIRKK